VRVLCVLLAHIKHVHSCPTPMLTLCFVTRRRGCAQPAGGSAGFSICGFGGNVTHAASSRLLLLERVRILCMRVGWAAGQRLRHWRAWHSACVVLCHCITVITLCLLLTCTRAGGLRRHAGGRGRRRGAVLQCWRHGARACVVW
jgi:hypothetical protein